ncbi:hypothetical protein [Pedobacter sp. BS3]|uniref:hypothetical protein n=1 Tax=Pedobacter sp. BS3 TaxID=2567937 RepID=UPI001659226C|nr:hypothetical protein [Pedobacter sp. BS3]
MKKTILAVALAALTCGAFAQTAPAAKPKAVKHAKHDATAKADTAKKEAPAKKVHKKKK